MKDNNKGLSYVEFIIVIAIMAIAVGLVSLSMGLVSRTNINRGAEKVSSSLNQARNTAMARGTDRGTIEISFDGKLLYSSKVGKEFNIKLDEIHLWDLENPNLYDVVVKNKNDLVKTYFAFREFKIVDKKFYLNDKPIFFDFFLLHRQTL